mmetsp:Transcript_6020/g.16031  ORF Transcript_6020/g.16031 Transcript_6020/m.16031 type:complete len:223 (+) Transcript_6020:3305-3973(+)
MRPEPLEVEVPQIVAIQQHPACMRVVEALHQAHHRTLAAATAAHQGYGGACLHMQAEVAEHLDIRAHRVGECHVLQIKGARHLLQLQPTLIVSINLGHAVDDGQQLRACGAALAEVAQHWGSLAQGEAAHQCCHKHLEHLTPRVHASAHAPCSVIEGHCVGAVHDAIHSAQRNASVDRLLLALPDGHLHFLHVSLPGALLSVVCYHSADLGQRLLGKSGGSR